jgi:hypothetical protein
MYSRWLDYPLAAEATRHLAVQPIPANIGGLIANRFKEMGNAAFPGENYARRAFAGGRRSSAIAVAASPVHRALAVFSILVSLGFEWHRG